MAGGGRYLANYKSLVKKAAEFSPFNQVGGLQFVPGVEYSKATSFWVWHTYLYGHSITTAQFS